MTQKGPKRQKSPNFFSRDQFSNQNEKNEHCYIEFCPVVEKNSLSQTYVRTHTHTRARYQN